MPELAKPHSKPSTVRSNKRLIILGAILVCVFVVWIVTMIAGAGFGHGL